MPYLLVTAAGYFTADIIILKTRFLLLPEPSNITKPQQNISNNQVPFINYATITSRNIFTVIDIPDTLKPQGQKNQEEDLPPVPSNLPLTLVGTIVHTIPERSIANIEVKSKNLVLSYHPKQEIENLAQLIKIERQKVIIRNQSSQRLEFIEIKDPTKKLSFSQGKAEMPIPSKPQAEVAMVAPNKFEIKRSDVLKYTNDMAAVLQQAAMAPRRNASGEIECFKFLSIQPGSIYTQLGFQNGDCLKSVNGVKIESPTQAMELYNGLKNSSQLKISVERDGRDQEQDYNIK